MEDGRKRKERRGEGPASTHRHGNGNGNGREIGTSDFACKQDSATPASTLANRPISASLD